MILDPAEPVAPSLELTHLLTGTGPRELIVTDAPPNLEHQAVVSRGTRQVTVYDDAARTARILTAMLAPVHDGWTINGKPARIIKPPLPDVAVTMSTYADGRWRRAAINSKPDLLPNCRIDGILTWLPGLENLAKTHLCQLPSPSPHWAPVGMVTISPLPHLTAQQANMEGELPPPAELVAKRLETLLPQMKKDARGAVQEANRHPLAPPPTRQTAWIKPRHLPTPGTPPPDDDALIIVSDGWPVKLTERAAHSHAEQTGALVALERADTPMVAVAGSHPDYDQGQGPAARDMTFAAKGHRLELAHPARPASPLALPMPLWAQGRYRPQRHPAMDASLLPKHGFDEDALCAALARCYEPDLHRRLQQASANHQRTAAAAATMLEHARRTARRLLQQETTSTDDAAAAARRNRTE